MKQYLQRMTRHKKHPPNISILFFILLLLKNVRVYWAKKGRGVEYLTDPKSNRKLDLVLEFCLGQKKNHRAKVFFIDPYFMHVLRVLGNLLKQGVSVFQEESVKTSFDLQNGETCPSHTLYTTHPPGLAQLTQS